MLRRIFGKAQPSKENLGLGLKPGDAHYRAYIGPPSDYDLVSAMVFNLLTCAGLRQHHKVLDIGCGSLRNGRLLIPYLNRGKYYGIEPNEWLVKDGISNEIGNDLVTIKQPAFSFKASMEDFPEPLEVDFALAQSIFSHTGKDLFEQWLRELAFHLKPSGALFGTFLIGDNDFEGNGWIYPSCVLFTPETVQAIANANGLEFLMLNWHHPRQKWAAFYKPGFDISRMESGDISWNSLFKNPA